MNYEPFTSIENLTLAHCSPAGKTLGTLGALGTLVHFIFLYTCRESSTNHLLFMQNKPNFRKSQMNVNSYNTTDYENKSNWTLSENKPNSNPIKPNLQKAKMSINSIITKDYRKKDDFSVRINKPNSRNANNERKLIYSKGLQKKNDFTVQKNKPNSNPIQTQFLQRPCCPWDSLRRTVDGFENFSYCTKQT